MSNKFCSLRTAGPSDIPFIIALEEMYPFVGRWDADTHARQMAGDEVSYLIGVDATGTDQAYAMLVKNSPERYELRRISVITTGTGFGGDFIKAIIDYVWQNTEATALWLDVFEANPKAQRLYERLGFTITGKNPTPEGYDASFGELVVLEMERPV